MAESTIHECCLQGFDWDGVPQGHETKLGTNSAYVVNPGRDIAVMIIHDLAGWTFTNTRLVADHYAQQLNATVYVPDLYDVVQISMYSLMRARKLANTAGNIQSFGGEVLPITEVLKGPGKAWQDIGVPAFISRNTKPIRQPEIHAAAALLRARHTRLGAVGFCFGGWAVFSLGAASSASSPTPLVDCITCAHPVWLTREEIDAVAVPVQVLAPEVDKSFTPELKEYCNVVVPTKGVAYEYQFFPGVEHAFATRGNREDEVELRAMRRALSVVVGWLRLWLVEDDVKVPVVAGASG